jgi:Fur family peroxide stress response transcriptional regulator
MSRATVYKTLALLKELGQLFEIDLRDDSHYDGNRPQPHRHWICVKCNEIVDGQVPLDPESIRELEHITAYTILRHQIAFYGLCSNCRKES